MKDHPAAGRGAYALPSTGKEIVITAGSAGGLWWPYKGLLPAGVSRRAEFFTTCIDCPAARERAQPQH